MNNDQRYVGYCDALEEAGIAPNRTIHDQSSLNAERGIALGRQLAGGISGICVSGDHTPPPSSGLRRRRARAEDVSIVGFDDVDIARMTFPPLTTIHQDGIAKAAARRSDFALIDGESRTRRISTCRWNCGAGDDGEGEITVSPAERPHFIFTSYK
ncbi:MAG: substrate-binding domain-containing protein [Christensenellales bacterium]